ncbi:senescence/dehydration-associated protein At4g35985, chloroplastic-like [Lycium ferocissimum]|uniref:senescence/dehydration-associated protein At4g35985, chloroplastic-like n=1 Tax=Lycium ferocissimum TaxID=112874 RepID=UPI0028152D2F|nr:senescence/dehydration-associated protein At4g35985, chloroplastic-like [Lycium ferocissimum]
MSSQNPTRPKLYPEVIDSNPPFSTNTQKSPSTSSMYPTIDMKDLAENLFPETETNQPNQDTNFVSLEQVIVKIPGAIVHLIDKERSIELASGEFEIVQLKQGDNVVAVLARVGDQIQWPLARDEAAVKLDESHYFFTLRVPSEANDKDEENLLNYGLTIASKGQQKVLKELDSVLEKYSAFEVEKVKKDKGVVEKWWMAPKDVSPEEMEKKKDDMERSSAAYWTTLAPNVEDYSSSVARFIAAGSGQLVKGILWCGDVTVDRLKWGNDVLIKRMGKGSSSEISPEAMRRMKRVKKMTKMSEKVATGILSGVVKVSGFFTSPIVNSKAGQKFFSLLPGEIVLASLDGFNKVCDAVEVAGRNVMSTTSVVTTGLVQQRHGDQAAQMTREGFDAAGHAMGTAWAVFKIRKALNPKSAVKPTSVAKAAAQANLAKLKTKKK